MIVLKKLLQNKSYRVNRYNRSENNFYREGNEKTRYYI